MRRASQSAGSMVCSYGKHIPPTVGCSNVRTAKITVLSSMEKGRIA